jgi:hypothetical protein
MSKFVDGSALTDRFDAVSMAEMEMVEGGTSVGTVIETAVNATVGLATVVVGAVAAAINYINERTRA